MQWTVRIYQKNLVRNVCIEKYSTQKRVSFMESARLRVWVCVCCACVSVLRVCECVCLYLIIQGVLFIPVSKEYAQNKHTPFLLRVFF